MSRTRTTLSGKAVAAARSQEAMLQALPAKML
jgi:hypothetical protein